MFFCMRLYRLFHSLRHPENHTVNFILLIFFDGSIHYFRTRHFIPSFEVKTTTEDNPDFVLTKQEYQTANKLTAKGETYQIYRFSNWGKPNQKLTVYDFWVLKEHWEFSPATYLCSAKKTDSVISGITYQREACGMSKGELADCLGIKTPDLWRYENDKRQYPVGIYRKMANVLNVRKTDRIVAYK